MNRTALPLLLLLAGLSAHASEPPSRSLTTKEISEGWILLFDGKTTFGWTSPNDSKWTVLDEMLSPQTGNLGLLVTTTAFRDFEISIDYQVSKMGELLLLPLCDERGIGERVIDMGRSDRRNGGLTRAMLTIAGGVARRGHFYHLPQTVVADVLDTKLKAPPPARPHASHLAFKGKGFILHRILLRPLSTQALFNGKDLSGWKEFPSLRSKFSVTKEGWLSIKDGKGDLQTTRAWSDFVLQLECRTNGKNLNSGVFFRCLPDKFQMGYEAQIHNGFGAGTDHLLETFDPQTHRLLEKKMVKFAALDYGTGAIYRRQPARFQAAKDEEWFTMTVVAEGRHFATWVNGMQTLDWTDHRPLDDNARKGCYLKAGPISLQGHDPTTDLFFRNMRIAELPAK